MKVCVSMSKTRCLSKVQCINLVGVIQNEMVNADELEIEEIANRLGDGYSCRPAYCPNKKSDTFHSQQLFMVEVDTEPERGKNKQRIDVRQAVEIGKQHGLNACFAYRSHNNDAIPDCPRYRLAFLFDRPLTDLTERAQVFQFIRNAYEGIIDPDCTDEPARFFFGGHQGICYKAFNAVNIVENCKAEIPEQRKREKKSNTKRSSTVSCCLSSNIALIQKHDAKALWQIMGSPAPSKVNSHTELMDFLRSQDLARFLGVPSDSKFTCILPEHNDSNPSAYVSYYNGAFLYRCFGCKATYNIKQIVEKLGNFTSEFRTFEFLKKVFNVSVTETKESKEFRENLSLIEWSLANPNEDGFSQVCPQAHKVTRHTQFVFLKMLSYARQVVPSDAVSTNGEIIFFITAQTLSKICGKSANPNRINKSVGQLCYLHLLERVPDEAVPKQLLDKVIPYGKFNRHPQYYRVPSFVLNHLQEIEQQANTWREHGYTLLGFSRELLFRTEGIEVASRVFPQTTATTSNTGETVTYKPNARATWKHEQVESILLSLIEIQGYCTEQQIIDNCTFSNDEAKRQIKKSLRELCLTHCLQRVRLNKELKQQLNIPDTVNGFPFIVLRKSDH